MLLYCLEKLAQTDDAQIKKIILVKEQHLHRCQKTVAVGDVLLLLLRPSARSKI